MACWAMIPAMSFDSRQIEDDPRADADAEAAVKRELAAFLREHGGFEGLAREAWRWRSERMALQSPR